MREKLGSEVGGEGRWKGEARTGRGCADQRKEEYSRVRDGGARSDWVAENAGEVGSRLFKEEGRKRVRYRIVTGRGMGRRENASRRGRRWPRSPAHN